MGDYILLAISCILINNILLAQYLGNCPFLGTSKKMETAVGMSMAVVFVLVMAGIAMLVLPGQGLLTILLGIMLLEFPGKRRVELMLLRRPEILAGLNWIRRHANRPPFEVCEEG